MKKVIIRADSSSTIGTGHIMRDIVLAKREFPHDRVIFAVRDLQGNINHKIDEAGYKRVTLESDDIDELTELVSKHRADTVVIDHYGIGYEDEKRLKEQTGAILFVLDDTYEKHYCDILLNHNIYAETGRYKELVPKHCELRCGEKFMLIQDEFYAAKKEKEAISLDPKGKKHVFVAMGGADTLNLNIPILETLKEHKEIHAHVVTTRSNRNLKALKDYAARQKNVSLYVETELIATLMAGSDFAIVTPSVTMNEVIFMELACIAIQTADNQKEMVSFLQSQGMLCMEVFNSEKLAIYIEELLDYSTNVEMFSFIDLNMEEKEKILQWRNHPKIRKWMFRESPIELDEHLRFIDTLKHRKDRLYFLIKKEGNPIGVIDLTEIDSSKKIAHFGIYSNPALRGKGGILMRVLTSYAFNRLKLKSLVAEVFHDNKKAIQLYRRFGFQEIKKVKKSNRLIAIMELKYEDWKFQYQ